MSHDLPPHRLVPLLDPAGARLYRASFESLHRERKAAILDTVSSLPLTRGTPYSIESAMACWQALPPRECFIQLGPEALRTEIEELEKAFSMKHGIDIKIQGTDWQRRDVLTPQGELMCFDVGCYLADCLLRLSSNLSWDQDLDDVRSVDFNQVVVVGFTGGLVLDPRRVASSLALRALERPVEDDFIRAVSLWTEKAGEPA